MWEEGAHSYGTPGVPNKWVEFMYYECNDVYNKEFAYLKKKKTKQNKRFEFHKDGV